MSINISRTQWASVVCLVGCLLFSHLQVSVARTDKQTNVYLPLVTAQLDHVATVTYRSDSDSLGSAEMLRFHSNPIYQTKYLYIRRTQGIEVLRAFGEPDAFSLIHQVRIPLQSAMALDRDWLYTFDSPSTGGQFGSWLDVYDISSPEMTPTVRASYSFAAAITLRENVAITRSYDGLQIGLLNLANPLSLTTASVITLANRFANAYARDDKNVLAIVSPGALDIFDTSDLAKPKRLATLQIPSISDIVFDGDIMYVAGGGGDISRGRLSIIDLKAAQQPQIVQTIDFAEHGITELALVNHQLFLQGMWEIDCNGIYGCYYSSKLYRLDVTNPSRPAVLSSIDQNPGRNIYYRLKVSPYTNGGYLLIGAYEIGGFVWRQYRPYDWYLEREFGYVADIISKNGRTFAMSYSGSIYDRDRRLYLPTQISQPGEFKFADSHLYLIDNGAFQSRNMPTNSASYIRNEINGITNNAFGYAHKFDVKPPYAYVSTSTGMYVVDTTDDQLNVVTKVFTDTTPSQNVRVIGDRLYSSSPGSRYCNCNYYYVADISNPSNPVLIGQGTNYMGIGAVIYYDQYEITSTVGYQITSTGTYTSASHFFNVADLSVMTNTPHISATIQLPFNEFAQEYKPEIKAYGKRAYIISPHALAVVNVENSKHPIVESVTTNNANINPSDTYSYTPNYSFIDGAFLFARSGRNFTIYNIQDHSHPMYVKNFSLPQTIASINTLAINKGKLFITGHPDNNYSQLAFWVIDLDLTR